MSDLKDKHGTTGHSWDGIEELNTPLPRWWLWTFYACIVWGIVYTILYPAWPMVNRATAGVLGYSTRAEVAADIEAVTRSNAAITERLASVDLTEISADPELNREGREVPPSEHARVLGEVVQDFHEYFGAMSEDRRQNPREDLATIIANAKIDEQPISFMDAMGYYIIAATAGHDTTSATTASAMIELASDPDILPALKQDPKGIAAFVEESIRWETPVKHFMRTATQDTEIAGQQIRKDDYIYLSYASANRDESVFAAPDTFNPARSPNKQVAFGYGPHVCLGQHLARLEMRVLWEELLPHIGSLELAGEPQRMAANFVCGPKSVPIRFTVS
mgnify:CR=1 FL=1